jgi:hypothetical protein
MLDTVDTYGSIPKSGASTSPAFRVDTPHANISGISVALVFASAFVQDVIQRVVS